MWLSYLLTSTQRSTLMTMPSRPFGQSHCSNIAFGSMNVVHIYKPIPDKAHALKLLNEALDTGYTMFDTAAMYGWGLSEKFLAEAIMHRRQEFSLATKGVLNYITDGKKVNKIMDGNPDTLKRQCEGSLKRLNTDFIDVYYLHRYDKRYPIEEQVGALGRLVEEGMIGGIGLSEVSADTLRQAHKEHPIAAMQSEYSLWTRNPEISVLETCKKLGVAFVAFSPTARKFLTGNLTDMSQVPEGDLRYNMPRFNGNNYPKNLQLLQPFLALAEEAGVLPVELAIAWVLAQGDHVIALPGTTNFKHMRQNANAGCLQIAPEIIRRAGELIHQDNVHGLRYNEAAQVDVDTERFEDLR